MHLRWQAYGMMGWRCGYIAYPTPEAGAPADLGAQLTKVQDTIPICASQASCARLLCVLKCCPIVPVRVPRCMLQPCFDGGNSG
jgi:hypothetical protein